MKAEIYALLNNKLFTLFSISFSNILLKEHSTLQFPIKQLESVLAKSFANTNEYLTVNSLVVTGNKTGTRYSASLYNGQLLMTGFCLAWIYKISG